mgnify:CR=1 FL=1
MKTFLSICRNAKEISCLEYRHVKNRLEFLEKSKIMNKLNLTELQTQFDVLLEQFTIKTY